MSQFLMTLGGLTLGGSAAIVALTAVLIVISKPPLKWHENFLLHKRFFFMLMK